MKIFFELNVWKAVKNSVLIFIVNLDLKWKGLPSLPKYIHCQFLCEQAFQKVAEAQKSKFENKEALKQASNFFFDIIRTEPFVQAYVGLAYLFLLLDNKKSAILYLDAATNINPHDPDVKTLLEYTLAQDLELKQYVRTPSFKVEEDFCNFLDDHRADDVNHLDDLPSEILVLIFDWLTPRSVTKFRQVSKYYRDLLVNNVYWRGKYLLRWVLPNMEYLMKRHEHIPEAEFYYQFYKTNHNIHVNWLNRATKFEEIQRITGEAYSLHYCEEQEIFALTLHREDNDQHTRAMEFFRFKNGNFHRIKRLHAQINVANALVKQMTTHTDDHVLSCTSDGTLVVVDIHNQTSTVHKTDTTIDAIGSIRGTKGIQFLVGSKKTLAYYDQGLHVTKTISVGDDFDNIKGIATQYNSNNAAILTISVVGYKSRLNILDLETESVVHTFDLGNNSSRQQIQWTNLMTDVLIGIDNSVTFYDIRTKNKFKSPCQSYSSIIGVEMNDVHLFALGHNSLTLFDCRFSTSVLDTVPLPKNHTAVPGLALWESQKLFYASRQEHVVEWDLSKVFKPSNN